MAWTSGRCKSCNDGTSFGPTIGLACGLGALLLLVAALAFTKRERITSGRFYQLIHRIYRIGKVKFSIILFACQARPLTRYDAAELVYPLSDTSSWLLLTGHLAVLFHRDERKRCFIGRLEWVSVIRRNIRSRAWRQQF